ncbi:MAG TPA: type II CAAX endopeptidase family protein [Clostridia bacterium]|nr:type II CAAX endopeptidase family protein [Clostridia bacterium]
MKADRMRSNHEVAAFFAATIGFTWLIWLPALLIQNFGLYLPLSYDLLIKAGSFVPSTAGFVFAYRCGGKPEVRSLFRSMHHARIGIRWILFTFLVLPGVSAVSCLIYSLTGNDLPQMQFGPLFIPIAFLYLLLFMGPLGEEAGWRGFALPRMLRNASPMNAAARMGIVWSFWHLPLFFINGTTQNALTAFGMVPAILGYFLYTLMLSVLITLLFVMSHGSVLGSILLHTVGNLSLGVVPLILTRNGSLIVLLVLSATTAAFVFRYRAILFHKAE